MKSFAFCLTVWAVAGCGTKLLKKDNNDSGDTPAPDKHVVAVVDEGFDLDNAVFQGRVAASYRVACVPGNNPLLKLTPEMRIEDLKSQFLAYLEDRTGCVAKEKLNDGISASFASIQGTFNDWNAAVKSGTIAAYANREAVQNILGGEKGKFNYHGTATAGLIAKDNDKVEMILIEPKLLELNLPNDFFLDLGCRSQVELDLKAQLFEDKEVIAAFTDANRVDVDSVIQELFQKHRVTLVNESYGPTSAPEFVDYYKQKQCPGKIDFKRVVIAEGKLMRAREKALVEKYGYNPLHVRASGNAGKDLNLESDTLDPCEDEDDYLMVGALDKSDQIAKFSNRGRCTEVYTLGEQVIVDAPENFLNVLDGTSFASPLMVRYLTLNAGTGLDKTELRGFALTKSDSYQNITFGDWNKPFAYDAKKVANGEDGGNGGNEGEGGEGGNDGNGGDDGNGDQLATGWTAEILQGEIQACTDGALQTGSTQEVATAFCTCAITGVAKKYPYATVQADPQTVLNDPLVAACRTQANGGN